MTSTAIAPVRAHTAREFVMAWALIAAERGFIVEPHETDGEFEATIKDPGHDHRLRVKLRATRGRTGRSRLGVAFIDGRWVSGYAEIEKALQPFARPVARNAAAIPTPPATATQPELDAVVDISHRCGHVQERDLAGVPGPDRPGRVLALAAQDCTACWRANDADAAYAQPETTVTFSCGHTHTLNLVRRRDGRAWTPAARRWFVDEMARRGQCRDCRAGAGTDAASSAQPASNETT